MVEAMAMRGGSSLANTMGCNQIIAESDAMEIIEACTGEQVLWSDSSAILADCVDMGHSIGMVDFKHRPRKANQPVDELARVYFSNKISYNWIDESLSFLVCKLIYDVMVVGT
jgi:hypothetical protein